jgi:hypothetical protein
MSQTPRLILVRNKDDAITYWTGDGPDGEGGVAVGSTYFILSQDWTVGKWEENIDNLTWFKNAKL